MCAYLLLVDPWKPNSISTAIAVVNTIVAIAAQLTAMATLIVAIDVRRQATMATKGTNNARTKRTSDATPGDSEDFLAGEFSGEFTDLSDQLAANIGTIARLAVSNGGYFGISVSDDGVTSRLVIRRGTVATDRRFYRVTDLEHALAVALHKLGK